MQAEMNKLFAEGGVLQQGGTVDPVSGNEVPPGAMAEEVRDDIPAQLSEGEFVIPADVVRYIGLEKLMMMRDKAKAGLKRMNEIGQMGNADEVPDGEALHGGDEEMDDDTFSSEIDSIMSEDEGGNDRNYAVGGYVVPENQQKYARAPIKGFEMVPMVNDAGQTIFIPFINGVAQLGIPTGYRVKETGATQAATTTPTTPTTTNGGGTGGTGGSDGGDGSGGSSSSGPGFSIGESGFAVANETNTTAASLAGLVASMVTGVPGLSTIGKNIAEISNFSNAQAAMGFNVAVSDTTAAANTEGITSAAATPGAAGTGGSAASAASAAASAAAAAGHSDAAIGAASQAAADAVVGGASAADAAAAAADAANAAAADAADAEGGGLGTGTTGGLGDTGSLGFGTTGTDTGTDGIGGGADSGGGIGAGDGGGGIGAGEGLAKGGLVSKRKKTVTATKQKGLASRK